VSEQNVEIVRRAFEAFNQRGLKGLLEFADPRVECGNLPRGRNLPRA
jgi:ketosteroid isomerase-like protein